MRQKYQVLAALPLLWLCFFGQLASAQTPEAWPTKPITMIVPFPPGGGEGGALFVHLFDCRTYKDSGDQLHLATGMIAPGQFSRRVLIGITLRGWLILLAGIKLIRSLPRAIERNAFFWMYRPPTVDEAMPLGWRGSHFNRHIKDNARPPRCAGHAAALRSLSEATVSARPETLPVNRW